MAYTTIDDPSAHFQLALWSAESSGDVTVTFGGNSDLQLDFLWSKCRNVGHSHALANTSVVSSGNYYYLLADVTDAEDTGTDDLKTITSDGFTAGQDAHFGLSGRTYVGFAWKANGGTTSSNSNGTNITSTVQANTTAGFSIVTFTGTGNDGDSYGHGLSSAPELVIPKRRDGSTNWQGYAFDGGNSQYFYLNLNNAFVSTSGNSAASSSSVITTDGSGDSNPSGGTVVSYCFHSVQGYSKIGRYTGNGNADGPFVYTGFKPAWVMVKKTSDTHSWYIQYGSTGIDSGDQGSNPVKSSLQANSDSADATENSMDFLSNGFKIRTSGNGHNTNSGTYLYMAFAEHPFVSSEGVPVTAR